MEIITVRFDGYEKDSKVKRILNKIKEEGFVFHSNFPVCENTKESMEKDVNELYLQDKDFKIVDIEHFHISDEEDLGTLRSIYVKQ